MQAQAIKPMKFQSNAQAMPAWEYDQIKRSERKQVKSLRALRQNRKGMWTQAD